MHIEKVQEEALTSSLHLKESLKQKCQDISHELYFLRQKWLVRRQQEKMLKNECIFCIALEMFRVNTGSLNRFRILIMKINYELHFFRILQFTRLFSRGLRVEFNQLNSIASRFFNLYTSAVACARLERVATRFYILQR